MRSQSIAIAAVMLVCLSGCALRGKKAVPPPPPPKPAAPAAAAPAGPLSIPQTRVELPPPQPLDIRALDTGPQEPVAVEPPEAAPAPKAPRKPAPAPVPATTGPQPETPAPQPAVEERPRLQEIVSPEEKRRLTEEIAARKREINDVLGQVSHRALSEEERSTVERIRSFVQLSDQAAGRGDMRQAEALSERALVLARELRNAK